MGLPAQEEILMAELDILQAQILTLPPLPRQMVLAFTEGNKVVIWQGSTVVQSNLLLISLFLLIYLTLYPLRRTAVFSKSVNTDSLPVYNIPSKSYWLAYFKNYIKSYEGCCHFERNSFKTQKRKTSKMCQLPNFLGIPLDCTSF